MNTGLPPKPSPGIGPLLARPRFELVPIRGADQEAAYLPRAATVTVTSSPRRGMTPNLELVERLAARGFRAVPHVSARLVSGRGHLRDIVDRLAAAGVEEVFVVGGDGTRPAGPYGSAWALLLAMAELGHPFREIGVAGYPERHPLVDEVTLLQALRDKEPMASYVVTQICFDPRTIFEWIAAIRDRGIRLPVIIGMPGAVTTRKLLEIALRIGVGDSLRFVLKQRNLVTRMVGRRTYRPDSFISGLTPFLKEGGHGVRALQISTFNQVRSTERWRQRALSAHGRDDLSGEAEEGPGFAS